MENAIRRAAAMTRQDMLSARKTMADQPRHHAMTAPLIGTLADKWWFAVPLLALVLLAPIAIHGKLFIFWDTEHYYHYGAQLVDFVLSKFSATASPVVSGPVNADNASVAPSGPVAAGITLYAARSPFYSVWLYVMVTVVGLWGVVVAQAVAIAWLIWRAATHTARVRRFEIAFAICILAAFCTGAWFFLGFVMPDAYAAIGLLCVALLFAFADRMAFAERLAIAALLIASVLFHATHLLTAIAVFCAAIAAAMVFKSARGSAFRRAMPVVGLALAGAVAIQFVFQLVAQSVLGSSLRRPPFLMARVIADGPGRLYLDRFCKGAEPFALCAFRGRNFHTADDFLWSGRPDVGVFQTLSVEQRLKLIDEEPRFVAAVATTYPIETLAAVAANMLRQFTLIWPAEAWVDPGVTFRDPAFRNASLMQVAGFLNSCIAQQGSCVPVIPEVLVKALTAITIVACFLVIAVHGMAAIRQDDGLSDDDLHRRALVLASLIVVGLIVNAAICGGISGPSARYQARIAWLAVVAAAVLEAARPVVIARVRQLLRM